MDDTYNNNCNEYISFKTNELWSSVVSFALNPQYWTPILRTEPLQPMRIGNCKLTISINYLPPLITITQKTTTKEILKKNV